jgi:Protein of unknown function (DUF2442)
MSCLRIGSSYSLAIPRPRLLRYNRQDMTHDIHKVERFEIVGPYTLALGFEDGTEQRIDFRPVLEGELFGPLKNRTLFDAVTLDKEVGTLTWPNGADFDPTTLHDWPQVRDELVEMARGWAEHTAGAQRTAQEPPWMPTTL